MVRRLLVLFSLLVLSACTHAAERPICSELTLAAITAECQSKIDAECRDLTEDQCNAKSTVLRDCDDRIEEWQRCQ
jgi:hypothetical protein